MEIKFWQRGDFLWKILIGVIVAYFGVGIVYLELDRVRISRSFEGGPNTKTKVERNIDCSSGTMRGSDSRFWSFSSCDYVLLIWPIYWIMLNKEGY